MNVRAATFFALGAAAPLGVYLFVYEVAFIGRFFLGVPLVWQLAIALTVDAFGGLLAGLTLVRFWRAGLEALNLQWPRWLRRAIVLSWAILGLGPPFFVFQEKASAGVAALVTALATVGLVWHHRRGRRSVAP